MSNSEKDTNLHDNNGLNFKRAPSASTFENDNERNMWEHCQSDINLSINNEKSTKEKVLLHNDSQSYSDLTHSEQGDISTIPTASVIITSVTPGHEGTLEIIPQENEIVDLNTDVVGLSPGTYDITSSQSTKLDEFSVEQSADESSNLTIVTHSLADDQSKVRTNCYDQHSTDKAIDTEKCAQDSIEIFPLNYFCESDFDDSRENIPNYQTKLKTLQDDMTELIGQLGITESTKFQWPLSELVEDKTKILAKCREMLKQAWLMPNVGRDCATSLCDLIRVHGLLTYLTICMSHAGEVVPIDETNVTIFMKSSPGIKRRQFVLIAAELYGQVLTCDNLDYILGLSSRNATPNKGKSFESLKPHKSSKHVKQFQEVVQQSWLVRTDKELNREFIAILEAMLKHDESTNRIVVQSQGLQSLIYSCRSKDNVTLRRAAISLVNLGLFGDSDVQLIMVHYKVADWLFPLAFHNDDIIKYYACLAIVVLSAHRELNQIIQLSGTMELVLAFIKTHSPYQFAGSDPSHFQGRSSRWLARLLPLLTSDSVEAVSLASFHFVMEARIKRGQGKTQIFKDIGVIDALSLSASSIHKMAAQFSRQALKILGIALPFSLSHPVPIWSINDVSNWLRVIGFESLQHKFRKLNIDGDLLLSLTTSLMENDLGLTNGIVRLRMVREITKLKMATTYETCDPTGIRDWLTSQVGPDYCSYTYPLLKAGIDRMFLADVTDEMLERDCLIANGVHRTRILNAVQNLNACKLEYQRDITQSQATPSVNVPRQMSRDSQAMLSQTNDHNDSPKNNDTQKNIDIFISYRRSNGAQLASLLMVHLKLRGYRVFLDIERLPAGRFNENLLQSIRRSRNFLIVLTAKALDRCFQDHSRKDWMHREVVCAMECRCNIIPVRDNFTFPDASNLPDDMKAIVGYNAVPWVHDYQDACINKIELFIKNNEHKTTLPPFSPALECSSGSSNIFEDMLNEL